MAKTGIQKYDELPSRMGWIDIDAIRAGYSLDLKINKIIRGITKRLVKGNKKTLDEAVKEYKKHKNCNRLCLKISFFIKFEVYV